MDLRLTWEFPTSTESDRKALQTIETFVVLEGTRVAHFYQEAVLQGVPLVGRIADRPIWLYVLPLQRIAVLLTEERDLMAFGQITELLVPYLTLAQRVVTINVEPSVSYKVERRYSDQDAAACFLRGINTKDKEPKVEDLLTPNLLTGVAAGGEYFKTYSYLLFRIQ